MEGNDMKEFLGKISELIGELDNKGILQEKSIEEMVELYSRLTTEEEIQSVQILADVLSENYKVFFPFMSILLKRAKSVEALRHIEEMLLSEKIPLWERIDLMLNLRRDLFTQNITDDGVLKYKNQNLIYESVMRELDMKMGCRYQYIPYCQRKKKVVMVVNQILSLLHAPTRKMVDIYKFFRELGYEVDVYVAIIEKEDRYWYGAGVMDNFLDSTTMFNCEVNEENILGYNVNMTEDSYLYDLRGTVGKIWDESPEFVFELGNRTLLADLCRQFTTVVSMACSKEPTSTLAPIVARYFYYSADEDLEYRKYVAPWQTVVDVKHATQQVVEYESEENRIKYKKEDFGIPEDQFVIVIAGNRLDTEITEEFLKIIYRILDVNEKIVIAYFGECKGIESLVADSGHADRMYFLGEQEYFREALAMADVFLNPPRSGGGTGGFYAILENVPVITLDHCDVESLTGEEFVCGSVEEMPALVERYFTDSDFMELQKENCRRRSREKKEVDSLGNFQKLCDLVKTYTLEKEAEYEG